MEDELTFTDVFKALVGGWKLMAGVHSLQES